MAVLAAMFVLPGNDGGGNDGAADDSGTLRSAAEPRRSSEPRGEAALPAGNEPQLREVATDRHFACDPSPHDLPSAENMAARLERRQQESERRARALEGPEDVDLRLAAALITEKRSPAHLQRLLSALALNPDHPLILERLLDACINRPDSRVCEEQGIVERAAAADGSNGQMWGAIAGYHASRGDEEDALEALRRAASAGEHREYLIDFIGVIERALAAVASDQSYGQRVMEAMGWSASFSSPWLAAYYQCRDRVADDLLWRNSCRDFALRLEAGSRTLMGRGLGIGMQAMIAEGIGDEETLAAVNDRREALDTWREEHLTTDGEIVLTRDERVLRRYIDEWRSHGEIAAIAYVREEVERLKRIPGYDPCALELP
ncbi:tetratricopeptide repeat protein [Lentisalinibacter sediminis]|uniref:hypothetical protein n=1 Tax=Lentisalinibacter sediminis TaxID=2992237 RepID=UPI003862EE0A